MPRHGENIYKRKDGRWEGRYIKGKIGNKAKATPYNAANKFSQIKLNA